MAKFRHVDLPGSAESSPIMYSGCSSLRRENIYRFIVQPLARAALVDAEAAHNLDVLLVGAVDDHLQGIEAVRRGPVQGSWPPATT